MRLCYKSAVCLGIDLPKSFPMLPNGWAAHRGRQLGLGKCCRGGGLQRGECGHVGDGKVWGGFGQLKLSVPAGASAFAREGKCAFLLNDDFGSGVRRVRFRRMPHPPRQTIVFIVPTGFLRLYGMFAYSAVLGPTSCT